jgi:hypothetical protein
MEPSGEPSEKTPRLHSLARPFQDRREWLSPASLGIVREEESNKLRAAPNIELAVHTRQVKLDRLRTKEQGTRNFAICKSFCDLQRDLKLLRSQFVSYDSFARLVRVTARRELRARAPRPRLGAQQLELPKRVP